MTTGNSLFLSGVSASDSSAGTIQLDRSCWLSLLPQELRCSLVTGLPSARASFSPRLAKESATPSHQFGQPVTVLVNTQPVGGKRVTNDRRESTESEDRGAASWGMDRNRGRMFWGPGRWSAVPQRGAAYQPGVEPRVCQQASDAF